MQSRKFKVMPRLIRGMVCRISFLQGNWALFGDGAPRGRTKYTLIEITVVTISTLRSFESLFVGSDVWGVDSN